MTKMEKAIVFATKAHACICRKGTDRPYILHPIEAMSIVMKFTDDEDLLAAAVLHDTVEDTGVTLERLEKEFGSRVASLVASVSKYKNEDLPVDEPWKERKQATITQLKNADRDTKLLCLGDKLAYLRDLYMDREEVEDFWERFNRKDRSMHAWYYHEICKILEKEFPLTLEMMEFDGLIGIVFE